LALPQKRKKKTPGKSARLTLFGRGISLPRLQSLHTPQDFAWPTCHLSKRSLPYQFVSVLPHNKILPQILEELKNP